MLKFEKTVSLNAFLYNYVVFALVLISVLQRNVFLSKSELFSEIVQIFEIFSYIVLLFCMFEKKYSSKFIISIIVLVIILLYGYLKSGMSLYFRSLLLIVAARNVDYNQIVRCMQLAIIIGVVISSTLYFVGLAPDWTSKFHYEGMGFGFGGGNGIGQLLCICVMMGCYIKYSEGKRISIGAVIIIVIINYYVTTSRTAMLITAGTPVAFWLSQKVFLDSSKKIRRFIAYSISPLLFAFTYISAMLYPTNAAMQKLDSILSNRVFLNYYALTKYPLTLFGQEVFLHDTKVYNAVSGVGNISVTVDCSYTLSLVSIGLIPSAFFSLTYILVIKKAIKQNNTALIGSAILLSVYAFTEVQMLEINYNFVYLSLLSITGAFENSYIYIISKKSKHIITA